MLPTAVRQGWGGPSFLMVTAFGDLRSAMFKTWKSNSLSRSHSKPRGWLGDSSPTLQHPWLPQDGRCQPTND